MYVVLDICLFEQEVYFKQYTSKRRIVITSELRSLCDSEEQGNHSLTLHKCTHVLHVTYVCARQRVKCALYSFLVRSCTYRIPHILNQR